MIKKNDPRDPCLTHPSLYPSTLEFDVKKEKKKDKNNQKIVRVQWFKINHRICRCIRSIKIKGRERNKKWRQRTRITRGSTEPYMLHARSFPNVRVTFTYTASPPLTARELYTPPPRHTYKQMRTDTIICTRIGRQNAYETNVYTRANRKKRKGQTYKRKRRIHDGEASSREPSVES